MLLKVIREKEIAYYNCQQIKEIIISHLYEDDGRYDVGLDMYNGIEPIRVFASQEDAEAFVARLADSLAKLDNGSVIDCQKI
jgi:hypothetical protein